MVLMNPVHRRGMNGDTDIGNRLMDKGRGEEGGGAVNGESRDQGSNPHPVHYKADS